MNEEIKEKIGFLTNFETFLILFFASSLVGIICFKIMFDILAEGRSSGYGDIFMALISAGITLAVFLISSLSFIALKNNKGSKFSWKIISFIIFVMTCFSSYLVCIYLVA
jgi:hypothetical protein